MVFFLNLNDTNNKNQFRALGGKMRPLVLNSLVTFVPGSVRVVLVFKQINLEMMRGSISHKENDARK